MNKHLSQTELTILVLAAGMGSRYGGLKQLDGVGPNGETIMDYSVFDAIRAGFKRVVFVIRADMEKEFMNRVAAKFAAKIDIDLAFQRPDDLPPGFSTPQGRIKPWGTAHAVWAARHKIDTPFAGINADDFYGAQSFQALADFLRTTAAQNTPMPRLAVVGYGVQNTLSASGPVSRAVCETDGQGRIIRLTERKSILQKGKRIVFLDEGGNEHHLPQDSYVSMNMIGFTPSVFGWLEKYFVEFLRRESSDPSSEYLLPRALNQMIAAGEAEGYLLKTSARWFGVTFHDDKPLVMQQIRQLIDAGTYPEKLWD